mmetsp:Transcript_21402/g.68160  ORF Transcript_21402/g.68160 Transcript_21402/m.68160 type:complete len:296 (+) Transcript_21402:49-936(+)
MLSSCKRVMTKYLSGSPRERPQGAARAREPRRVYPARWSLQRRRYRFPEDRDATRERCQPAASQPVPLLVVLLLRHHLLLHLGRDAVVVGVDPADDGVDGERVLGRDGAEDAHLSRHLVRVPVVHVAVLRGPVRHDCDVERGDHLSREVPRRVDDHVARVAARQHRQHALLLVEQREVAAAVPVDHRIRVHADEQKVAQRRRLAQESNVPRVEHVPAAVHVHHPRARRRGAAPVRKQAVHSARRQELALSQRPLHPLATLAALGLAGGQRREGEEECGGERHVDEQRGQDGRARA